MNRGHKNQPKDKPEDCGFIYGSDRRQHFITDNGYEFTVRFQLYVGMVAECKELQLKKVFMVGTRWSWIADWINSQGELAEAA